MADYRSHCQRETDLLLLAGRGDARSFAKLHTAMHTVIRDFVVRRGVGLNWHEIDDVVQEVFIRAWKNAGKYQARSSARTYLLGITMNVLREAELDHRKARLLLNEGAMGGEVSHESYPSLIGQYLDDRELVNAVAQAKTRLTVNQVQAIELVYLRGFAVNKAARLIGCNSNQFRSRLWRARMRLKKELQRLLRLYIG